MQPGNIEPEWRVTSEARNFNNYTTTILGNKVNKVTIENIDSGG